LLSVLVEGLDEPDDESDEDVEVLEEVEDELEYDSLAFDDPFLVPPRLSVL
jgi:hypothetical protein